jgi:hypothetical protein
MLVVPALAACTVVGWFAGGRIVLALLWLGLAGWMIASPLPANGGFELLARGWSVLLAAAFGVLGVLRPRWPFFTRAMWATSIALLVALGIMMFEKGGPSAVEHAVVAESSRRNDVSLARLRELADAPEWKQFVQQNPGASSMLVETQRQLSSLPNVAGVIYPALLALESLAALGLAWSLYHRVSRARIGAPLSALRDFRFNDQLVWGPVAGITMVVLPALGGLRPLGFNLLLFFGALYSLRGLGVLTWFLAPGRFMMVLMIGIALLMWPILGVFTLGIGLGDTWLDWRRRPRPTT